MHIFCHVNKIGCAHCLSEETIEPFPCLLSLFHLSLFLWRRMQSHVMGNQYLTEAETNSGCFQSSSVACSLWADPTFMSVAALSALVPELFLGTIDPDHHLRTFYLKATTDWEAFWCGSTSIEFGDRKPLRTSANRSVFLFHKWSLQVSSIGKEWQHGWGAGLGSLHIPYNFSVPCSKWSPCSSQQEGHREKQRDRKCRCHLMWKWRLLDAILLQNLIQGHLC